MGREFQNEKHERVLGIGGGDVFSNGKNVPSTLNCMHSCYAHGTKI